MISDVIQSDEFSQYTDYRQQVGVLCTTLRENVEIQLVPYERICSIFNLPKSAVFSEQYIKYKNGTPANGRPFYWEVCRFLLFFSPRETGLKLFLYPRLKKKLEKSVRTLTVVQKTNKK